MAAIENPTEHRRRNGRPSSETLRVECARIGELLARGLSEHEIRAAMRLNRDAFRYRLRCLHRTAINPRFVWAKYQSAQVAEIRTLAEIGERALACDPPAFRVAVQATLARARIRRELLEVGQGLGVWERAVEDRELFANPTIGMFLDAGEGVGLFAGDGQTAKGDGEGLGASPDGSASADKPGAVT